MKQVILCERETLKLEDNMKDIPCGNNDVVIQVKAVTICGSDISYFKADKLPHNLVYPLVLGHEVSGVVVQKGRNVSYLSIHDRVAIEPDQYCGDCYYCKRGQYNFCEELSFMASKGEQGALKEYITWPGYNVFKLNDEMSFEDGALLEPLSVAYSAIKKLELNATANVAILGAGSIGVLIALLIQALYPNVAFHLIDMYEEKMKLGIHAGISKEHFIIQGVHSVNHLGLFSDVIDTTGVSSLMKEYLGHSVQGVRLVCVGVSNQVMDIHCKDIVYQGVQIIGSYRYAHTYPKLLQFIKEKQLCFTNVITGRYPFEDAQNAFEQAMDTRHNIKVAIMFE